MTKKTKKTNNVAVGILYDVVSNEFIGQINGLTELDMIENAKQIAHSHNEEDEYIVVIPQKIIVLEPEQSYEFVSYDGTMDNLPI